MQWNYTIITYMSSDRKAIDPKIFTESEFKDLLRFVRYIILKIRFTFSFNNLVKSSAVLISSGSNSKFREAKFPITQH
jgi:hypothetical protein